MEVACDESGYEGERLVGGTTDVFAHASVRLDVASAEECVRELRDRIRSPATEYKANHVLRGKHRAVLIWLLGADGPTLGSANVYLVDKAFLLVAKVVELLLAAPAETATALYRDGRRAGDRESWDAFLAAANGVLRRHRREEAAPPFEALAVAVDRLRRQAAPRDLRATLGLLSDTVACPDPLRERLRASPSVLPPLDPLMPAIVRAALRWGVDGVPVEIVHDRQRSLSDGRVTQLIQLVEASRPGPGGAAAGTRLTGLRLVASYADPRVQVADFVAGVARKVASEELSGRGDDELIELLRPYVDTCSVWGDARSWARLRPAQES